MANNQLAKLNPSDITTTKLKSLLEQDALKINELLEVGENDSAISLIYKRLTQSCIDAIPLVEDQIRNSKGARGIYQYEKIVATTRELLADLQAMSARSQIGTQVVNSCIQPFLQSLALQLMTEFKHIEDDARSRMSDDEFIAFKEQMVRTRTSIGNFVSQEFKTLRTNVEQMLQR